jgi:hypothetical protein
MILFGKNLVHGIEDNTAEKSEEKICPICYETLNFTSILPCKHQLCTKCWLYCLNEGMIKCPICRDDKLSFPLYNLTNTTTFTKILDQEKKFNIPYVKIFLRLCCTWKFKSL